MRRILLMIGLWLLCIANANAMYDNVPSGSSGDVQISLPDQKLSAFRGENISLPDFRLSFHYKDINIPGPNGLNLVFARGYHEWGFNALAGFGGYWFVDLPHIQITLGSPSTNFGCLGNARYMSAKLSGGVMLRTVGFASSSDLPSGTVRAFDSGEILTCEGNAPKVILPNGHKYSFDHVITSSGGQTRYPTRLEDRFGNYINFNYTTVNGQSALSTATRSDGASYTVNYGNVGGGHYRITSVTFGNRSVNYTYQSSGSSSSQYAYHLHKHIDPESRETVYSGLRTSQVILPTGATISYTQWATPSGYYRVQQRTISGSNIPSRTTTFNRNSASCCYGRDPNDPNFLLSTVTEIDFDGSDDLVTEYRFHNYAGSTSQYNSGLMAKFGKMTSIDQFLGGAQVYELENTWTHVKHGEVGCSEGIGLYHWQKNCGRANLELSKHSVYNTGGVDEFESDPQSYDKYGFPLTTRIENHLGVSRYVRQEYAHNLTYWLMGRHYRTRLSTNGSSWNTTEQTAYHSTSGSYKSLPRYFYVHGIWQYVNSEYHANGELKRREYNGSSRYEQYDNYKRGIPRLVTVPRRYTSGTRTLTRTVDDYGNVTSENDYTGTVVSYTYDKIDRLLTKNYADPIWADESWYYADTGSQYQRVTIGDYRRVDWFDALGRVRKTRTVDLANTTATRTYVSYERDKAGHVIFESFPSTSSSPTNGIDLEYDALGRKVGEVITETGTSRQWDYLSGHRVRYTDGKNHQTTTIYESFGAPSYEHPKEIQQPESVTTSITYNLYNNIESVSQGGITETYLYDSRQRLCKRVRPDINNIGFGYNSLRQVTWRSHGSSGSDTACGGESSNDKITYTYDNRGEPYEKKFPDSTLLSKQILDADGNATFIESKDGIWAYSLNSRDLIELETLTVNGRVYQLDWTYNDLGHVQSLKYPDGQIVSFSPNALGQPSQAGSYATGASYHETGMLEGFIYGNGIVRSIARDAMGRPTEIRDFSGSSRRVEHDYVWDTEHNLEDLFDRENALWSINDISYDGLHRLKSGDGQWGAMTIQYLSGRHDIQSVQMGSNTLTYAYAGSSGRLSSVSGEHARSYSYDARGNVSNNRVHYLTYNIANQITQTSPWGLDCCNGRRYMEYDGHGRRIEKRVDNGLTKNFIYGSDGKLYHLKTVGGQSENYIYLAGTQVAKETSGSGGNGPPNTFNDSYTISDTGQSFMFSPLGNDNDPDGDPLSITSVTNGQFSIEANGTSLYFGGSTTEQTIVFNYSVSDGNGGTSTSQITLEVEND